MNVIILIIYYFHLKSAHYDFFIWLFDRVNGPICWDEGRTRLHIITHTYLNMVPQIYKKEAIWQISCVREEMFWVFNVGPIERL